MREQSAGVIRNPVLAGSHPDPSVLRVGSDFYLATSTFEWYPGVRLCTVPRTWFTGGPSAVPSTARGCWT
ncbi:family 43 glycosylhydrolase [Streptomyces sp. 2A115]|uniref:family 43 glycosylhydrolase n=1 Tax=Streptomyces sp. 2A115 TaxID=3457439 RepID=UPI003FD4CCA0